VIEQWGWLSDSAAAPKRTRPRWARHPAPPLGFGSSALSSTGSTKPRETQRSHEVGVRLEAVVDVASRALDDRRRQRLEARHLR
jgi:hypothetical protein